MKTTEKIHWAGASIGNSWYEKVAINVPVILHGQKHFFQLDTSSPQSFIFSNALELFKRNKPGDKIAIEGMVPGLEFSHNFICAPFEKTNNPLSNTKLQCSGIIGIDFIAEKGIILDLKNDTVSFPENKDLPVSPHSVEKINAYIDNHLFFDISIENDRSFKVLLNTGPGIFPLIVQKNVWEKLTLVKDSIFTESSFSQMQSGTYKPIDLVAQSCQVNTKPDILNLQDVPVYYPKKGDSLFCFEHLKYSAISGHSLFYNTGLFVDPSTDFFALFDPEPEAEELLSNERLSYKKGF